ncbi:MAG TPA: acyl-CoA dehydrogenase family protein [Chloroflexota bacterium]|nr:acyl-CoA dehydrogenase family protein [Chloroflexota bacterium]
MRSENYFSANPDLRFYFETVIDWDRLVPLYAEADDAAQPAATAGTWRDVLDVAGDYVGRQISARAAEVDRLGTPHRGDIKVSPPMAENLRGLAEMGVMGLALPREYGGEGMPFVVNAAVIEMLARADAATMVQYAFYSSPATMILRFGSDAQKHRWVPRLASGEIIGWVAMTEPEAGSDVGNVSTSATRQADGTWRITGRKQFISSGNGQVGVLLARAVPGSRGLDGLALFLVPRCIPDAETGERENFEVERAEEKVCINGSPTCALAFADSYAEILGSPGDGWHQITTFMNEARIAVGIQACGVAHASLVAAQDYAAQRVQMKKPIREHPLVAEMLLDMETTVAGLRALWMESAVAYDLVRGLDLRLRDLSEVDPERPTITARKRRLELYLRELTPLVKYFGAEEAIRVARLGMQVFGGYGVIKDYDVERFLRDSLILPIYEGTSQIQSLMATKDLLKAIVRNPRSLLIPGGHSPWLASARFDGEMGRLYRGALRSFSAAVSWLMVDLGRQVGPRRAAQLMRGGSAELDDNDLAYVLLSAERLTQMLAHLHIGRLLAQQAQRWPERRPLAERFLRRASDVCRLNTRRIMRGDRDALEAIQQWHTATAS